MEKRKKTETGRSEGTRRRATAAQAEAGRRNLAAGRLGGPNLKSGIAALIKSKGAKLPALSWAAEVAEQVDVIVRQMLSDLGYDAAEDAPAAQRAILESQRLNLLVLGLANRFLRAEGITDRKGKPHAILAVCVSFSNSLRHNALALGLGRKARRAGAGNLAEYLAMKPIEKNAESVEVQP